MYNALYIHNMLPLVWPAGFFFVCCLITFFALTYLAFCATHLAELLNKEIVIDLSFIGLEFRSIGRSAEPA